MQFPLDENVVWRATEPGSGRVSAITEIEGEEGLSLFFYRRERNFSTSFFD